MKFTTDTSNYEKTIEHQFVSFCKTVLRNQARNIYADNKRWSNPFVSLESLTPADLSKLCSCDNYEVESIFFSTLDYEIPIKDILIAQALEYLSKSLSKYYNDLLSVSEANRKATGRWVHPATIKKIHEIIRCALNQAILWEYLDTKMRNPASMATSPKIPKNRRNVWNIDTFKKAISFVNDDLLLICMQLAFSFHIAYVI